MHLGDRGPKWQEESPQSKRIRPHPPWRSQMGVRHMVTYLKEQKTSLYIWEERGEGKSHHMGAL